MRILARNSELPDLLHMSTDQIAYGSDGFSRNVLKSKSYSVNVQFDQRLCCSAVLEVHVNNI